MRALIGAIAGVLIASAAANAQTQVRWLSQTPSQQTQFPIETGAMERITGSSAA